ncbi:hypothetical protein BGZ88_003490 [Linnemannia elongata]|nr:hypothetical protein BGZ88_003490 [Linnemannia elongata]
MNMEGESDALTKVLFSPDGRVLVCAAYSGIVRQFDAISGESGPAIVCGYNSSECLAVSPDGLRISSAGTDGNVTVWDFGVGQAAFVLRGHSGEVKAVAFSADGRWIATGGDDKTVQLWDARSGILDRVLEGLTRSVWLWKFVADTSAEGEGRGEWKCLVRIRDIFGRVLSIAWKPDMLEFGIGCKNGSLQVWKLVETSSSSDGWSAQLVWSTGNPVLAASDAVFADAIGLSSVNQKLLTQRGKDAAA